MISPHLLAGFSPSFTTVTFEVVILLFIGGFFNRRGNDLEKSTTF